VVPVTMHLIEYNCRLATFLRQGSLSSVESDQLYGEFPAISDSRCLISTAHPRNAG
jgi:hypothetical protein